MLCRTLVFTAAVALAVTAPAAAITIDGTLDGTYGAPLHTQATQTNFGDASSGDARFTNGSEIDAIYVKKVGSYTHVFLAGNLESNFNKLDIFFDSKPGGQQKLRGDNSGVDFGGLNRMGDDGSGNGLRFDPGIEPDYWMSVTGGDVGGGVYKLFVNYAELPTAGGGPGYFVGEGTAVVGDGALTGGTNPYGIQVSLDNSNTGGVGGGCAAGSGAGVTRGIELKIHDDALGYLGPAINGKEMYVAAFINGGGHDFVSNQVVGSLPAVCNLGEPRAVDFGAQAGPQFAIFAVGENLPAASPWTMLALSLAMAGVAILALRRRALVTA